MTIGVILSYAMFIRGFVSNEESDAFNNVVYVIKGEHTQKNHQQSKLMTDIL